MKKQYLLLVFLISTLSCKKKEPVPACGCEGPVLKVIENEEAIYRNGLLIANNPSWYAILDCNTELSVKPDVANGDSVLISGNVRRRCNTIGDVYTFIALPTPLELTAIRKK
jgi:hypothetical protein